MSRRPFSLTAYLAAQRDRGGSAAPRPPRPAGPCVWLHSDTVARSRALDTLVARLAMQQPEIVPLRTGTWDTGVGTADLPAENLNDCGDFLEHWRPDICLWTGTGLRPALLWSAHERGVPLLHADPGGDAHHVPNARWLPDPVPLTLSLFDTIFMPDAAAERRLPRTALPATRLRRTGPLTETTLPLDCDEDRLEDTLLALAGRPVWLAARLRGAEARQVIEAHRRAIRLSHRLLLALVSASEEDAEAIEAACEASDMRLCRWDDGDPLDETAQLVLSRHAEEIGLWYRLAPLAFLGGSLIPGHGGTDPFEAAALGTAILYGPNVGRHLAAYSTLVEAGAARIVRDEDSLAGAVSQLLAPDRAAAMAHAGWDIASAGAAATDAVIDRILDLLDARREGSG